MEAPIERRAARTTYPRVRALADCAIGIARSRARDQPKKIWKMSGSRTSRTDKPGSRSSNGPDGKATSSSDGTVSFQAGCERGRRGPSKFSNEGRSSHSTRLAEAEDDCLFMMTIARECGLAAMHRYRRGVVGL
jgi:hypothetical protein